MTPKKAYNDQLHHARERGIDWLFPYDSWLEMWLVSEKWPLRGKTKGAYCMCRYHDEGPYSPQNCFIDTVEQNQRDRWSGKEKITNEKSLKIIESYFVFGWNQYQIAEEFGIDQSYVSRIVNQKRKA